MKGLELPVNILVVIAVAVIVLLGVTALYLAGFGPFAATTNVQTAWSSACNAVVANCAYYDDIYKLGNVSTTAQIYGNSTTANLYELCKYRGLNVGSTSIEPAINCRKACGCTS